MSAFIDLTGQRFTRLIVLFRATNTHKGQARWTCLCDCGSIIEVTGTHLRIRDIQSCGCLHREKVGNLHRSHSMSKSPEYNIYNNIKRRCNDQQHQDYPHYGGRGIVCLWQTFEVFLAEMGMRPSPELTVERVNNDGPYSKENCIWATRHTQARNTRRNHWIIFHGQRMLTADVARLLGVHHSAIIYRIKNRIPLENPPRQDKRRMSI